MSGSVQNGSLIAHACQWGEEFGVPTFPVRVFPDPANPAKMLKRPLITGWQNGGASTNPEVIEEVFTAHPDATHVGLQTGEKSRILAIDLDGEPGLQWWRENFELLPATRTQRTQRPGGKHLLYRLPTGCKLRNSAGKIAEGVDIRAGGGFIVDWSSEFPPEVEDITDAPPALIEFLQRVATKVPAPANPSSDKIADGKRNDSLASLGGKLRRVGLEDKELEAALLTANELRCNPPLAVAEVTAIARSIARYAPGSSSESAVFPTIPARSPLDWPALEPKAPPQREWALQHWLPLHHPSLLAGRGGIGKTLAAQHLGTAMVLGREYIDQIPREFRVLFWAGEDDEAELWRRQLPICTHFGVTLAELKNRFFVQSYDGADITLAAPTFGQLGPTLMLNELKEQVHDYRADYVFLDNIARIYGGNENDRHQATQFLAWLTAACAPAGVCLLGHPSKGVGSEYSGSTAWEGAVRARLYLSDRLPDAAPDDEDAPPDDRVRYLSRRKSNYSPNDWRRLDLLDGVLVPEPRQFVSASEVCGDFAKDIVKRAVRKLGDMSLHGNASTRSPEYLPRLANQYGLLDKLSEKRFGAIMRDLIKDGELTVTNVGQYSNRTAKTGLVLK
jgi:hypothetical protein